MLGRLTQFFRVYFCGFIGGIADVVPGISGGTVYYVLGVYDTLIASLQAMPAVFVDVWKNRSLRLLFSHFYSQYLIFLFLGVITAFITLAPPLHRAMNSQELRPYLYALFFGLVLGSFCIITAPIWKRRASFSTRVKRTLILLSIVGVLIGAYCDLIFDSCSSPSQSTYSINIPKDAQRRAHLDRASVNFDPVTGLLVGLDIDDVRALLGKKIIRSNSVVEIDDTSQSVSVELLLQNQASSSSSSSSWFQPIYFISGVIAVTAMLLPGISGSYMLHVIGMYGPIMSYAVAVILMIRSLGAGFDFLPICILMQVALGIIFGAYFFSLWMHALIRRYYYETHVLMSGCLLGSISVLWPFQKVETFLNPYAIDRGGYEIVSLGPRLPSLVEESGLMITTCFLLIIGALLLLYFLEQIKNRRRSSACANS